MEDHPTLDRLLANSSFALPLAAAQEAGRGPLGGLGLWGGGEGRSLSGGERSVVEWEGRVTSAHLGADRRVGGNLLAGVALSLSRGDFEYTDRAGGGAKKGDYEVRLTSVHPYAGWRGPRGGVDMWASVGYGWGEVEIDDEEADPETADLTQKSASLGARGTLLTSRD